MILLYLGLQFRPFSSHLDIINTSRPAKGLKEGEREKIVYHSLTPMKISVYQFQVHNM